MVLSHTRPMSDETLEAGNHKETDSSLKLPEEIQPCQITNSHPGKLIQTSQIQYYKNKDLGVRLNIWRLKPCVPEAWFAIYSNTHAHAHAHTACACSFVLHNAIQ